MLLAMAALKAEPDTAIDTDPIVSSSGIVLALFV
jgi:hypothetical protein